MLERKRKIRDSVANAIKAKEQKISHVYDPILFQNENDIDIEYVMIGFHFFFFFPIYNRQPTNDDDVSIDEFPNVGKFLISLKLSSNEISRFLSAKVSLNRIDIPYAKEGVLSVQMFEMKMNENNEIHKKLAAFFQDRLKINNIETVYVIVGFPENNYPINIYYGQSTAEKFRIPRRVSRQSNIVYNVLLEILPKDKIAKENAR